MSNMTQDSPERMHIVTVQFAVVLDGEVPIKDELEGLVTALQIAYNGPEPEQGSADCYMPQGSFRVVSVGPEEDHRDLDPCFGDDAPAPNRPAYP